MVNASFLIIISCSIVGMFEQLKIMQFTKSKIKNIKTRSNLFSHSIFISLINAMVGANQTIVVIMRE